MNVVVLILFVVADQINDFSTIGRIKDSYYAIDKIPDKCR